jgi:hypothetical protein
MDVEGRLEGRQNYTIHGGPYARLFFTHKGDAETVHQAQLPIEAIDADLQVGDAIVITYLLRTVMEIRRAPGAA